MVNRHTHIGGTRWIHLWLELRHALHIHSDFMKIFQKTAPLKVHPTNQSDIQQFLYHTSHNLKGPVSRLKGLVTLILLETENKKSDQYVGKIDQEVKQMEKILAKLQTISDVLSVEHGVRECKLGILISQILDKQQEAIMEKNILVKIDADEDLQFWTEAPLLHLILDNLIENAIQYAKAGVGQPKLEIGLKKTAHTLHILVEDNGEGIRYGSEEKVFELFYRDSENSNGGGLGLYVVKEALKKLGGSICLESEEDQFTRFSLNIPEKKHAANHAYAAQSGKTS